jgi:ABC-2 type transport system permease protein
VFSPTQVVVSLATVLPSALMLFFLLRIITPLTMGAVIAVALVNVGGSWLGGKLLDARMPKILATLDDFASLQQ